MEPELSWGAQRRRQTQTRVCSKLGGAARALVQLGGGTGCADCCWRDTWRVAIWFRRCWELDFPHAWLHRAVGGAMRRTGGGGDGGVDVLVEQVQQLRRSRTVLHGGEVSHVRLHSHASVPHP